MFTIDQSIDEILENDLVNKYLDIVYSVDILKLIGEEFKDKPLSYVGEHCIMPWGVPFLASEFLDSVNMIEDLIDESKYLIQPLWQKRTEGYRPNMQEPTSQQVCLLSRVHTEQTTEKKPAVIICPGGGYETRSIMMEGFAMAERMEQVEYRAFVCIYRVSPNRYPIPQEDLALAIKHVRANAETYCIDPENVMVMGSSAGGHLCASVGLLHETIDKSLMEDIKMICPELTTIYEGVSCRPDKICLNYPVISFVSEAHEPSFQALSGGEESLREALSIEQHVDNTYPKTFVWSCEDDELVPVSNAVRMGAALEKAGCEYELHIYPTGGHGCGLAYHTSAKEWSEKLIEFMK